MFKLVRKSKAIRTEEETLTPLEIFGKIQSREPNSEHFELFDHFKTNAPRHYLATSLHESSILYSAGAGARSLIIMFGGKRHRPMLPPSVFLQMLNEDMFDVLMLKDLQHLHYDGGVPGWGASLNEVARNLNRYVEARGYHGAVCCGTSMGGLPALRAGRLMGTDRAISIGGRFVWHISRLIESGPTVGAFDCLCPSVAASARSLHVYGANDPIDPVHASQLARMLKDCRIVPSPLDVHNVFLGYFRAGFLKEFLSAIFESPTTTEAAKSIAGLAAIRGCLPPPQ